MSWRSATAVLAGLVLVTLSPAVTGATQCDVTATSMGFGNYDPLSPVPLGATATLDVRCKPPKQVFTVTIQLSGGNGSIGQRQMNAPGGGTLRYNIYLDPGYSTIFGDGSGGSADILQDVTKATPWSLTLYGRIPALQNVVPGVYSDILTATILY